MSRFKKRLPEWNREGIEPPNSKKTVGWQPDERPPAEYLNWLANQTFESLKELQDNAAHKEETEQLTAQLAEKVHKGDIFRSVKDFGAKGDGITDDTHAIQEAINSTSAYGVVFFPSTPAYYKVTSLTIPNGKHLMKLMGAGKFHSRVVFSLPVAVSVQSENFTAEHLHITGAGINTAESVIFKDERPNNRADFDLNIIGCYIQSTETVVQTKGRGCVIDGNNIFYEIRYQIIKADYPSIDVFEPGHEDVHKYSTGYRGFIFRNNRVHYSPCMILNNTGANKENLNGVLITGNQLEGSTGYIEGYVKNGEVSGNIHYQCDNVREALFMLHGCENLKIDVNVSGMKLTEDGFQKKLNKLLRCTGFYKNLTVRANVQDVLKHVFEFTAGGTNLDIQVNANDICTTEPSVYNLVKLDGAVTYNGVKIKGTVNSPGVGFTAVNRYWGATVRKYNIDFDIIGDFDLYHNLNAGEEGIRRPVGGTYTGDGTANRQINTKYAPAIVQIYSDAPYYAMKNKNSSVIAPDITLNNIGFTVTGNANKMGVFYSYLAQ